MKEIIVIENLVKRYKSRKHRTKEIIALDRINLKVNRGETLGLIGPNGAGKTTLLKVLSTLILPDEGVAYIDGYDIIKDEKIIKTKVSLVESEFNRTLYWRLTGKQNMKFFANLRDVNRPKDRIDYLMRMFELKDWEDEIVAKYSTGMKRKLTLAIALLHDPPILFLDEPLSGIDPFNAYKIKRFVKENFKEKTIIWASHNIGEIEEICDRVVLINNGKIELEGKPEQLKNKFIYPKKIILYVDQAEAFKSIKGAIVKGNMVEIEAKNINETLFEIIEIVKEEKIKVEDIMISKPKLEDILMGVANTS